MSALGLSEGVAIEAVPARDRHQADHNVTAACLVSDDSRLITKQSIRCDDGLQVQNADHRMAFAKEAR